MLMIRRELRNKIARRLARVMQRDVASLQLDMPLISLTFDDVIMSACTTGADILARYNAGATWYVSGGFEDSSSDGRFHDRAHLQKLHAAGHEIACHGYAHLNYQDQSPAQIAADLDRNLAYFDAACLPRPRNFAYPYGAVSPAVKAACASRFRSCRGIHPGHNGKRTDLNLLHAVPLYSSVLSQQDTRALVDALIRTGGWLIFLTHGVTETPDEFDCTPEHLDDLLAYASDRKVPLVTVDEALNRLCKRPLAA